MIYYTDPRDESFTPQPLKPVTSVELAEKEIQLQIVKAKTDDEKELTYFYKELVLQ
jgi:hypothetical protein